MLTLLKEVFWNRFCEYLKQIERKLAQKLTCFNRDFTVGVQYELNYNVSLSKTF